MIIWASRPFIALSKQFTLFRHGIIKWLSELTGSLWKNKISHPTLTWWAAASFYKCKVIWNISYIELWIGNQVSYDHPSYERNLTLFPSAPSKWCLQASFRKVRWIIYHSSDCYETLSVTKYCNRPITGQVSRNKAIWPYYPHLNSLLSVLGFGRNGVLFEKNNLHHGRCFAGDFWWFWRRRRHNGDEWRWGVWFGSPARLL